MYVLWLQSFVDTMIDTSRRACIYVNLKAALSWRIPVWLITEIITKAQAHLIRV